MSDKIVVGAKTPPEFIYSELLRIRNYENNFDGEDSITPPVELVDSASRFFAQFESGLIPAPHRVSASVNQTVLFEWYSPWFYHSIEFVSPSKAEATWIPKDAAETVTHEINFATSG